MHKLFWGLWSRENWMKTDVRIHKIVFIKNEKLYINIGIFRTRCSVTFAS